MCRLTLKDEFFELADKPHAVIGLAPRSNALPKHHILHVSWWSYILQVLLNDTVSQKQVAHEELNENSTLCLYMTRSLVCCFTAVSVFLLCDACVCVCVLCQSEFLRLMFQSNLVSD